MLPAEITQFPRMGSLGPVRLSPGLAWTALRGAGMNPTPMCVDSSQSSLGDLPLVMEFGILASGNSVDPHGRAREFLGSDELLLLP